MTERFLRLPAVIDRTGYSRSSIYALIAQGKFPRMYRLSGGRAVAWKESEINEYIESQSRKGAA